MSLVARDHAKDDDFKLEEFLPSVPDKELGKAWEALSARLAPLVDLVTASGAHRPKSRPVVVVVVWIDWSVGSWHFYPFGLHPHPRRRG